MGHKNPIIFNSSNFKHGNKCKNLLITKAKYYHENCQFACFPNSKYSHVFDVRFSEYCEFSGHFCDIFQVKGILDFKDER